METIGYLILIWSVSGILFYTSIVLKHMENNNIHCITPKYFLIGMFSGPFVIAVMIVFILFDYLINSHEFSEVKAKRFQKK